MASDDPTASSTSTSDASEAAVEKTAADWARDLLVYAPIGFALDAHTFVPQFVERGRNQVALARFIGQFAVGRLEKELGPLAKTVTTAVGPLLESVGLKVPPPLRPDAPTPPAPAAPARPEASVATPSASEAATADPAPAPTAVAEAVPAAPKRRAASPGRAGNGPAAGSSPRTRSARSTPAGGAPAARTPRVTTAASKPAASKPAASKPAGSKTGPAKRARAKAVEVPEAPPPVPVSADLGIPDYDGLAASQVVPRLASLQPEELQAIARYEAAHRGRRTILHRVDQLLHQDA